MRYRKLDENGDMTFGNGQLDFYRDVPEAVGQAVSTRLQLWLGEFFLNIDEGTPYLLGILGKHSKESADATLKDRIENTQGFSDIESYSSDLNPDTRKMSVVAEIDTIYGPTKIQVASYANY